jgi:hypothetical protein
MHQSRELRLNRARLRYVTPGETQTVPTKQDDVNITKAIFRAGLCGQPLFISPLFSFPYFQVLLLHLLLMIWQVFEHMPEQFRIVEKVRMRGWTRRLLVPSAASGENFRGKKESVRIAKLTSFPRRTH